jgi:twinkle protein
MTANRLTSLLPRHLAILDERGIDAETLVRHGIVSCDPHNGEDWIAIPFWVGDQVVNWKYRTIGDGPKNFRQEKNAQKIWWNYNVLLDRSLDTMPLVVTEGEMDALIALQCGHARTMSVPDGAPAIEVGDNPSSQKYSYVTDTASTMGFDVVKEIILATDGDGPGGNLMNDLAIRLGKSRCKFVRYPRVEKGSERRCKDLNEVYMCYGAKGVTGVLSRAQWIRVDGVYRMDDLPPIPERPALRLGMPILDDHYRVRTQDFVVFSGIPSHGKTSALNEIGCRAVTKLGWVVAYASFEQAPQLDHKRNLRTWYHRKPPDYQSDAELTEVDAWINRNFVFIVPSDDDQVDLKWALEKSAAAVIQHGVKMLIIDPWNEMDHIRPGDMTLTEYTGFAIKEFKRFARKYDVHLIVAAHPTKQLKDKEGNYQIPTLYDISDSANWANKADIGMVIWRGKVGGDYQTKLRIAKARYAEVTGEPGDVELRFNPYSRHFEPIDTQGAIDV